MRTFTFQDMKPVILPIQGCDVEGTEIWVDLSKVKGMYSGSFYVVSICTSMY